MYRQQYIRIVTETIVFFIAHSLTTVNTIPLQLLSRDHYLCMHLASIEHFYHQKHKKPSFNLSIMMRFLCLKAVD